MKVINFIEEGRYGGPQARIVKISGSLAQYNIRTNVVYSKYDSERFTMLLENKGIEFTRLPIIRLSKERITLVKYLFRFIPDIFLLYRFFKKSKPDIIHINGAHQIKGAIAAKLANLPLIWHLNDTCTPRIIKKLFLHVSSRCATGYIVAGKKVHDYYLSDFPLRKKPFAEIHAPVDTNLFSPHNFDTKEALTSSEPIESINIITICNISPVKGLDSFIKMASRLNESNNGLIFSIGGPVYSSQKIYFKYLEQLIVKQKLVNLHFLGRVDNVPKALAKADIFVLTSLAEASPTSVWEAMSMGKAIVATDVGSVNQFIENGKTGYIVPVNDIDQLYKKVKSLIDDPILRIKIGSEARKIAMLKLDISTAAKEHAAFYERILHYNTLEK